MATFAETLSQASTDASNGTSAVQGLIDAIVERFKEACMKAADQTQRWASCTYDEKLPDGVSIKMLLNGNVFYKLLQKNLKALKLADVKIVDWSVYDKAEIQEKVLDEDGKPQYKVKEVASAAAQKKTKRPDDGFAVHKWAPKTVLPEIGKGLPTSGLYYVSVSSQKALDGPLATYAQLEQVMKKVAGPGPHVKVQLSGRWL